MFESDLFTVLAITVVLLGFSAWMRKAPRHGGLREWEGSLFTEHVVLLVVPGLGTLALGGLIGMIAADTAWILLAAVPMLAGVVMIFWGGFLLPIPRWFLPRDVKARAKARKRVTDGG